MPWTISRGEFQGTVRGGDTVAIPFADFMHSWAVLSDSRHHRRVVWSSPDGRHETPPRVERAQVAGWSGGGPHAIACAALLPDRVIGTTTIASVAPWPAEGLDWLDGMGQENIDEFNATLAGPESHRASLDALWPTFRDVTPEALAEAFGDLVDEVDRGAVTGEFAAFLAANMHEGLRESHDGWFDDDVAFIRPWGFDLSSIRGTVHIWQGAHDRMVPFAHGQWLAAHIPTACVHLYPEHGHLSLAVDSFPAILDEMITSG